MPAGMWRFRTHRLAQPRRLHSSRAEMPATARPCGPAPTVPSPLSGLLRIGVRNVPNYSSSSAGEFLRSDDRNETSPPSELSGGVPLCLAGAQTARARALMMSGKIKFRDPEGNDQTPATIPKQTSTNQTETWTRTRLLRVATAVDRSVAFPTAATGLATPSGDIHRYHDQMDRPPETTGADRRVRDVGHAARGRGASWRIGLEGARALSSGQSRSRKPGDWTHKESTERHLILVVLEDVVAQVGSAGPGSRHAGFCHPRTTC